MIKPKAYEMYIFHHLIDLLINGLRCSAFGCGMHSQVSYLSLFGVPEAKAKILLLDHLHGKVNVFFLL